MSHAADSAEANRLAFERLTKSDPVLIDVRTVGDFVTNHSDRRVTSPVSRSRQK
mgnify:CR=1 FL=1